MATNLGLTANAIRAQLASMERDGLVRRVGQKRGSTRPSHLFGLTGDVEQLLSGLYVPMLINLVAVLDRNVRPERLRTMMRQTGRRLAANFPEVKQAVTSLGARANAASDLITAQLGGVTHVERHSGGFVIRGAACPIAAITVEHPSACSMLEGFLQEVIGSRVRTCCRLNGRPQCCFEIKR